MEWSGRRARVRASVGAVGIRPLPLPFGGLRAEESDQPLHVLNRGRQIKLLANELHAPQPQATQPGN
jgi:hypothetical protein